MVDELVVDERWRFGRRRGAVVWVVWVTVAGVDVVDDVVFVEDDEEPPPQPAIAAAQASAATIDRYLLSRIGREG